MKLRMCLVVAAAVLLSPGIFRAWGAGARDGTAGRVH